jgi:sulfur carrier protein ThiS
MRMHRGSSKGAGATRPPPERLPLSASATIEVQVEVARAGRSTVRTFSVAPGTLVKELVRAVGESSEGAAVLVDGVSLPMDSPVTGPTHLVVVPTFSGG